MTDNTVIAEDYKVKVFYRGVQVGRIIKKEKQKTGELFLKAKLERRYKGMKFDKAVYRETLLGNRYIELTEKVLDEKKMFKNLDTLYGVYSPLFKEIDSTAKNKILKEIGALKKVLDSVLEKK